jgi:spore germination cell wall hydrolase CwlJ-like protein
MGSGCFSASHLLKEITMRVYANILLLIILMIGVTLLSVTYEHNKFLEIKYTELTTEARKQVDCLADNIYYEAGYEESSGQLAVALVTMNRTQDPRFPKDICSVVKQKNRGTCQFSWFCEPRKPKNLYVYRKNLEVALHAYANYEYIDDLTKGAIYYHADYVNPRWKLSKTTQIGRHIFYKDKDNDAKAEPTTKGRAL